MRDGAVGAGPSRLARGQERGCGRSRAREAMNGTTGAIGTGREAGDGGGVARFLEAWRWSLLL